MAELTRERLGALRVQAKELLAADRREVLVCAGTGCIAGGSLKIYDYLKSECEKRGLKTRVALRHEGGDDAIHFKKSGWRNGTAASDRAGGLSLHARQARGLR